MLEFRKYSDFPMFLEIYEPKSGAPLGVVFQRPDNVWHYASEGDKELTGMQLATIAGKLRKLNETS